MTECWAKQSTITCSNAVGEYNLLSTVNIRGGDFIRITAAGPEYKYTDASSNVTYTAGDDLPRRDIAWLNAHNPGWRASTGTITPESYYLRRDAGAFYLGLQPPTTIESSAAGEILLPYVAQVSSLTADTNVPFTDTAGLIREDLKPYHQAAVHYAAHKLELLRKDTEASDRQLQKFLGYVTRFIQTMRPKAGQTIRPARSYFSRAGRGRGDLDGPRAAWWR